MIRRKTIRKMDRRYHGMDRVKIDGPTALKINESVGYSDERLD